MSEGTKAPPRGRALAGLALAALGVVYGDIGTSPLYALRECFTGEHGLPPTVDNVLGILSLIVWSLNFVVSFKYISLVMRADNRGEGGILALMALVRSKRATGNLRVRRFLLLLGLFGAALLYGDGVITPAISVLGAMEGLKVVAPAFDPFVVPITVAILLALFLFQKRGTAGVGLVFGPITLIWFICITLLGIRGILLDPSVIRALNPWYAVNFFAEDGLRGFLILGAVVLVFTGGEALYADMGHFGKRPIRVAWFGLVLPALLLNYFGQGALLLHDPSAAHNPFYALVPTPLLIPMIVVATAAAIVASQALISGAFSLTQQAVQLGYSPRVTIKHTSHTEAGQIYIPEVNQALAVACIGLVLAYRSSSNLAAAYGIAVTGTMTITTVLYYEVMRARWNWPLWKAGGLAGLFLLVDATFFSANLVKVPSGGWFPIVVAIGIFTLMATWKQGRILLSGIMRENALPMDLFLRDIARRKPPRVPGVAVFLTSDASGAPPVLLHHLKHNQVLHERVILLSVVTKEIPVVPEEDRLRSASLGEGFCQVIAHYGFMESPDVPAIIGALSQPPPRGLGLTVNLMQTTFYLGRETLIATGRTKMATWRKKLFIVMTRNAQSAATFFRLPPNRVVELGAQIQL
ncbi:MAG TPA: potassium transporter Kup [Gemmatimonadales bacterium]|nr:potassium transporter Kup [Gemmatimonadales bacterium]